MMMMMMIFRAHRAVIFAVAQLSCILCVYAVNFPTHGHSAGADVVDALPAGCGYKSGELSVHSGGAGGCSASSSSSSSLLLDQQRHYVMSGSTSAAASGASMLPSFGFTQEQVRARSANQRCPLINS